MITIGTDVQIINPCMYQFSTFECLAETMEKLNARLAQDPIQGGILFSPLSVNLLAWKTKLLWMCFDETLWKYRGLVKSINNLY